MFQIHSLLATPCSQYDLNQSLVACKSFSSKPISYISTLSPAGLKEQVHITNDAALEIAWQENLKDQPGMSGAAGRGGIAPLLRGISFRANKFGPFSKGKRRSWSHFNKTRNLALFSMFAATLELLQCHASIKILS